MSDFVEHWDVLHDRGVVAKIRSICAREFGLPVDYDFFSADYRDGEPADDALLRLFNAEKKDQRDRGFNPSIEDVTLVLCHG